MTRQPFYSPPSKNRVPYGHQKKKVPMTIALGFPCKDGVVLAADSEITGPNSEKSYEQKLFIYPELVCKPAFAYAGTVNFSHDAIRKLKESLLRAEADASDLEMVLRAECKAIWADGAKRKEWLELLIAIRQKGAYSLYVIRGGPDLRPLDSPGCLGVGAGPLTHYILDGFWQRGLSTSQAATVAAFAVAQAKRFVQYCGGEAQILSLRNGVLEFPLLLPPKTTKELEQSFAGLQQALRPLLLSYAASDHASFQETVRSLGKRLRQEQRLKQRREARLQKEWETFREEQNLT
jgi:hypothetical protein